MTSLNINENSIREISCFKEISAVVVSSRCKISLSQTETSDTAGKELTGYTTTAAAAAAAAATTTTSNNNSSNSSSGSSCSSSSMFPF